MGIQKSVEALQQEEKLTACPDCNSADLDSLNGEQFCKHCGLVIE